MKLTKQTIIATAGSRTSTAFLPSGKLVVAQDYGETKRLTVFFEGKAALEITESMDGAKVSRRMLPHVETTERGDVLVSYKTGTKGLPDSTHLKYRGVYLARITAGGQVKIVHALGSSIGNGQVQVHDKTVIVMGRGGEWESFDADTLDALEGGGFPMGDSGEKCQFRLGVDGRRHTVMNGYHNYPSRYNSDYLIAAGKPPIMVFDYKQFPMMGSDFCHVGLGVDLANPKRAFVGSYFGPLACLRMITPKGKLTGIARFAATFEGRFGPQMIPRPQGGCLCLFNRGGVVMAVTCWKGSNKWRKAVALCPGRYASGAFSPAGTLTVVAQTGAGLTRYDFA